MSNRRFYIIITILILSEITSILYCSMLYHKATLKTEICKPERQNYFILWNTKMHRVDSVTSRFIDSIQVVNHKDKDSIRRLNKTIMSLQFYHKLNKKNTKH